jgi:large subunit ribosomal protein L35
MHPRPPRRRRELLVALCPQFEGALARDNIGEELVTMPKLKTHKGMKKRFKISATGKVSHKRCGSSHLNSHKSGKRVRRLRKASTLKVTAEARRIRNAMLDKQNVDPQNVTAHKLAALAKKSEKDHTPTGTGQAS